MSAKLHLGTVRALDGQKPKAGEENRLLLPARDLVTHGAVLGMTGSGKTGLVMVMVEEALRAGVPALCIDVKGDLPNLLLSFPSFAAEAVAPWLEVAGTASSQAGTASSLAEKAAQEREHGLRAHGIDEAALLGYSQRSFVRVVTPGSDAGELLHLLSSLERPTARWAEDPEAARATLSAAVSLVLRLLGRDADPARSKEHVLLSVLAERRLAAGQPADIPSLLADVAAPPITTIGALGVDEFLSKRARKELAASLNNLLAAPMFRSWREGSSLDVAAWMRPVNGRTPATVLSVAHLDDDERELVLGLVLEEVLSWVRGLPGSRELRALIVFDEVFGFLPPHPQNPPTKRPLVALMKQARAFGVLVATQNPMDLDYRALSNAGLWCLGRLQTDADRERVIEGLANEANAGMAQAELRTLLKRLAPRWFFVRNVHAAREGVLLQPRWAMSLMRGPMTRAEIRRARKVG